MDCVHIYGSPRWLASHNLNPRCTEPIHFLSFMKSMLVFKLKKESHNCSLFIEDMTQSSLMTTVTFPLETFPFRCASFGRGLGAEGY